MACCNWGKALPSPWQHAKYWAGNYAGHPDYDVVGNPVVNSIGCRASGFYGHVAWVTGVNGGTVTVYEQSCCEGTSCWPNCSYCIHGFRNADYSAGYYDGGYIVKAGAPNVCGDGNCAGGENCASCPGDCGACCGNNVCDNAETCGSCPQDCGGCCGNGSCGGGENCSNCPQDCGQCPSCGDGQCKNGEGCNSCPQDCGPCCPNGNCGPNESCKTCPQDCGQCCPNGKCSASETCSSCPEDCGACNQAPKGALETVTCAEISGWAKDPDKDGPIKVRIIADQETVATIKAKGQHPSHPGHGFSYQPGPELKDGQVYSIKVEALDDQGELDTPVQGSGKALRCRNETVQSGIWTFQHVDSAGLEISPVAGSDPRSTSLLLSHPGGLPYPNSGSVIAQAQLSFTQFDRLEAAICGGLESALYSTTVAGGPEESVFPGEVSHSCLPLELPGPGDSVSALLQALKMVKDPPSRQFELADLGAWANGWRFDYSFDADGAIWGSHEPDRFTFKSREQADGCQGVLSASRTFAAPFGGVKFEVEREGQGPLLQVSTDSAGQGDPAHCPGTGACVLDELSGQTLTLGADCAVGGAEGNWLLDISRVRVFKSGEQLAPPWVLTAARAWGLDAMLPAEPAAGLSIVLAPGGTDYIPTGGLLAEFLVPEPPMDAVRGTLIYSFPGVCYHGLVTLDGVPVRVLAVGAGDEQLEIDAKGHTLGVALLADDDCTEESPPGFIELAGVSYRRNGWWTTPTSGFAGIRDERPSGCGVGFSNLRWWGMEGKEAFGRLLVHRMLEGEAVGIRYRLAHTFPAPLFSLRLLLDGKLAREHFLSSPADEEVEVHRSGFTEVGFAFSVDQRDVYPFRWGLQLEGIEVQGADGLWHSICDLPAVTPAIPGPEIVEQPGDIIEPGGSGADRSGGCSSQPAGHSGAALLLVLAFLVAAGLRMRSCARAPKARR